MSREIDNPSVGRRLRAIREARGVSQQDFADSLGISLSGYKNYERGERSLTKDLLVLLYEKYKIDPSWLLFAKRTIGYEDVDLDKRKGVGDIVIKCFGLLKGLKFKSTPSAQISLDQIDAGRFFDGCLEYEKNKENQDSGVIKQLELLKEHYYSIEGGDLKFTAEVELPPLGVRFEPDNSADLISRSLFKKIDE
jgi:transcriptional regulator with XRE-family HTH domain